jgi:hypothetical protein
MPVRMSSKNILLKNENTDREKARATSIKSKISTYLIVFSCWNRRISIPYSLPARAKSSNARSHILACPLTLPSPRRGEGKSGAWKLMFDTEIGEVYEGGDIGSKTT